MGITIGRGSLPQEFLDSDVSSRLRLPTPQPQYLFAQMALGGRMRMAALNAGQTTVQQYVSIASSGGQVDDPDLDRLVRFADAYPDAIMTRDEFGKNAGDTIKMRRRVYSGGGYTEADRERVTGKTTSTTGQRIAAEDIPMVLKHYRGPYASGGSSVEPYVVEEFDWRFRAQRSDLANEITSHLHYDYIKWLDTVVRDRFRSTSNITYVGGATSVSAYTSGAGYTIDLPTILNARKSVSDREWQPFSNGKYLCLVPTSFQVQMADDARFVNLVKNNNGTPNPIYGYIGEIENVVFAECTTLKEYAATNAVPGDSNTVPSGATVYEALLFGPGCVGFGTGQAPEARFMDDTDAGAVAKIIWDAKHAFQTLDNRGIQRILFQAG